MFYSAGDPTQVELSYHHVWDGVRFGRPLSMFIYNPLELPLISRSLRRCYY